MGKKLTPEQLELYQSIDEILWKDWDPIGISGSTEARDEYYSYLPVVFRMAMEDTAQQKLADYLFSIEKQRMGLDGNMRGCLHVAELILKRKNEIAG